MKKVIWRILICMVILTVCAFGGRTAYILLTDQSHIDETFYRVQTNKLVSSVRAVFLSDLHLSEFGEDNADLVQLVRDLKPDIILIGGDMNMRQEDDYSCVLSLCRQLLEITDTYYAIGNHEISRMLYHDRDIYYDLKDTGVTMLHNVFEKVTVGRNTLYIGGVSQTGGDIATYSNGIIEKLAAQDGFKLLLSHYPSDFEQTCEQDIDLVLSGHLHGGQVNLPYIDGLFDENGGLFPEFSEGEFYRNGTTMIVSRGLGNSHNVPRVNNSPELIIVDINPGVAVENTNLLISQISDMHVPSVTVDTSSVQTDTDSNMFRLMQLMEIENQQYIDGALDGTSN